MNPLEYFNRHFVTVPPIDENSNGWREFVFNTLYSYSRYESLSSKIIFGPGGIWTPEFMKALQTANTEMILFGNGGMSFGL